MLEPAEVVRIFQRQLEPKLFSAGEVIFEEGQPGDVMYGILEGEVDLVVNGKTVETIKTGDVFGEGALVHQDGLRASTAIAKTDCNLAFLDQKRFLFAVQETPMFALEVMRSFSNRLRHLKRLL
ncbi:cyclic nucleotide-binding domain-containing protein [Leptolyngbya sp. FACHB-261]|uniref:cyclic nucleotide-binding domain-containing protein n=1 Tax=Leptolyngbya sp. FACHB-261 TaxID=2692806 RepID=UPI001682EC7E|nr:cyclic nucleotide-binding domain-containing protein [Leptolyngbya sp. FACHB-261]MBD2102846.1 cyclic nucleotide-binding domain-containing protein [Leptolyngbya sp. FACHB-261]